MPQPAGSRGRACFVPIRARARWPAPGSTGPVVPRPPLGAATSSAVTSRLRIGCRPAGSRVRIGRVGSFDRYLRALVAGALYGSDALAYASLAMRFRIHNYRQAPSGNGNRPCRLIRRIRHVTAAACRSASSSTTTRIPSWPYLTVRPRGATLERDPRRCAYRCQLAPRYSSEVPALSFSSPTLVRELPRSAFRGPSPGPSQWWPDNPARWGRPGCCRWSHRRSTCRSWGRTPARTASD